MNENNTLLFALIIIIDATVELKLKKGLEKVWQSPSAVDTDVG